MAGPARSRPWRRRKEVGVALLLLAALSMALASLATPAPTDARGRNGRHPPQPLGLAPTRANHSYSRAFDAVAGAMSGAIASTVTCPLDVLKTRLQVQRAEASQGVVRGIARICEKEGFRGLYTGIRPTLLALLPNWAAYFPVYSATKAYLIERYPEHPSGVNSLAAFVGGAAALAASNPFWVAKTRLQTQALGLSIAKNVGVPYKGPIDCITRIAREEGLGGLYSGVAASVFGLTHVAIQFPIYEMLKTKLEDSEGGDTRNGVGSLMAASAMSKFFASTCTYPHEVVRSYMQVAGVGGFGGIGKASRYVFAEDGIRGFYRGYFTNLCRTVPTAAVTLPSFEIIRNGLDSLYLRTYSKIDIPDERL
mmetsp:Transcript_10972/g.26924  ORF Transcript_10972/g.26924 Transcript_10972/m.26924 type:complete len:366 (-) Transcript_10972:86-1183(-)